MDKATFSQKDILDIYTKISDNYGDQMPSFVVGMVSQLHAYKTVMQDIEKTAFFSKSSKMTPFKAILHIQRLIKKLHSIPKVDIDMESVPEEPEAINETEKTNESPNGE